MQLNAKQNKVVQNNKKTQNYRFKKFSFEYKTTANKVTSFEATRIVDVAKRTSKIFINI